MINQKLIETYIDNGFNILLQGKHGVGKTMILTQACESLGLELKYYSASSLDPYTDLVGIPVPTTMEDGTESLKSVRPQEINEAEVIFFDELNRAEPKVLNAVFELIQFGSINGEKLPNLKCVIAAQNPPNDDYTVDSLDPALADRFQITLDIEPEVSLSYLKTVLQEDTANSLFKWHKSHGKKADYVSPRRIEMMGHVWEATHDKQSLSAALPPGTFDVGKLFNMLNNTALPEDLERILGDKEAVVAAIRELGSDRVVTTIKDAEPTYQTKALNNVAEALNKQFGPVTIVQYLDLIDMMTEDQVKRMTDDWATGKRKSMGTEQEIKAHNGTNGMKFFKEALDEQL